MARCSCQALLILLLLNYVEDYLHFGNMDYNVINVHSSKPSIYSFLARVEDTL